MIRLYCRGNVLEYTGDGWMQCSRSAACPKKKNNKILGFDCLSYMDNLPENIKLMSPEMEILKEIKDAKEAKEIKEPIRETKEISKEIQDMKEYIGPIITVPSRKEIDRKVENGKDKEKQNGNLDNEILIGISPLVQKMKLVEKAQA